MLMLLGLQLGNQDMSLRALVCAEFGYRPDQTWGRTKNGRACLYVKDVNSLLDDHCRRLHEAVTIAPNAKWIIVGGSPCQDLTFAGAFKGLLGLVGKNSRLFFALLGTIRAMQDLATKRNIRFLVENAGSMVDLHYQAFCKLLGLPSEPKSRYLLWDPAEHGYGITRKRNFFRGHDDSQTIQGSHRLNLTQAGPLLLQPFFLCIAERAVKRSRSSRASLLDEVKSQDSLRHKTQKQQQKQPQNHKQHPQTSSRANHGKGETSRKGVKRPKPLSYVELPQEAKVTSHCRT